MRDNSTSPPAEQHTPQEANHTAIPSPSAPPSPHQGETGSANDLTPPAPSSQADENDDAEEGCCPSEEYRCCRLAITGLPVPTGTVVVSAGAMIGLYFFFTIQFLPDKLSELAKLGHDVFDQTLKGINKTDVCNRLAHNVTPILYTQYAYPLCQQQLRAVAYNSTLIPDLCRSLAREATTSSSDPDSSLLTKLTSTVTSFFGEESITRTCISEFRARLLNATTQDSICQSLLSDFGDLEKFQILCQSVINFLLVEGRKIVETFLKAAIDQMRPYIAEATIYILMPICALLIGIFTISYYAYHCWGQCCTDQPMTAEAVFPEMSSVMLTPASNRRSRLGSLTPSHQRQLSLVSRPGDDTPPIVITGSSNTPPRAFLSPANIAPLSGQHIRVRSVSFENLDEMHAASPQQRSSQQGASAYSPTERRETSILTLYRRGIESHNVAPSAFQQSATHHGDSGFVGQQNTLSPKSGRTSPN